MDNIDKLPDDLKCWITPFIVYDENKVVIASNPCAIMVKGSLHVLAMNGGALVFVSDPFAASLPLASKETVEMAMRILGAVADRTLTVNLRALQLWCGPALATAAEFDNDGNGPWFAPRMRSCVIFDAHIDGNLLAHALAGFEGGGVVWVSYRGPTEPIIFSLESGAVALMPMSTGIARLNETGLHNPWDKEEANAEPETRA
jgi:hypothetical protein